MPQYQFPDTPRKSPLHVKIRKLIDESPHTVLHCTYSFPCSPMRSTLTLSLPAEMLESLRQKAKRAGMSVSGYVRRLVTHESHLITEDEVLARWKEAKKNYRAGKVKVLRSFNDLMK